MGTIFPRYRQSASAEAGRRWATLPEAALLAMRIGDLPIFRRTDPLSPRLSQALATLHGELATAGCPALRPWAYWGDEWFCPEGLAAIAVPFWLAHPRLTALEVTQMGRAEGAGEAHTPHRHRTGRVRRDGGGLGERRPLAARGDRGHRSRAGDRAARDHSFF